MSTCHMRPRVTNLVRALTGRPVSLVALYAAVVVSAWIMR